MQNTESDTLILHIDENTIKNILKTPSINEYFNISDEKGKGYLSGDIKNFKSAFNNDNIMSNQYTSGMFDQIANFIPEFKKTKSNIIPSVKILTEDDFIKNVKMNYPYYKIEKIIKQHIRKGV